MISTINREPWNGGCLIFAFPNKSDNALCKGSAYFLSTREEFLLLVIVGFNCHHDLPSNTSLRCCEREIGYIAATIGRNRQEHGRIMVPLYG
jgi:hypothetical protein